MPRELGKFCYTGDALGDKLKVVAYEETLVVRHR